MRGVHSVVVAIAIRSLRSCPALVVATYGKKHLIVMHNVSVVHYL